MNQLYLSLKKAGLMFKLQTDQGENEVNSILLGTCENGTTQSVDVDTFEIIFGDVKDNPTYEALSGSHSFKLRNKQYHLTAAEVGYQKYFDQWKKQGLFKF